MANTTNIDLVKPAGTDHALVSVLNANSDKIDGEAGNVRSNFALVQNTNTATQAISKDQLVVWKGVLKKATSNIANGATLSNSNLTDTKVSTELAALSDQISTVSTRVDTGILIFYVYKTANICVLNIPYSRATQQISANTGTVIGTLPNGYIPSDDRWLSVCLIQPNGTLVANARIKIAKTTGDVTLSASATIPTNVDVIGQASYVI